MNDSIKQLAEDLRCCSNINKILDEQNHDLRKQNLELRDKNVNLRTEILDLKKPQYPHEKYIRQQYVNAVQENDRLKAQIDNLKHAGRHLIEIARFVDEFQILDLEPLFKEET